MQLPRELREAIESLAERARYSELEKASAELSARYEAAQFKSAVMATEAQRLAYIATRLPATYAANLHALGEVASRMDASEIRSMLDLGAGPGTTMWAAAEAFPAIERITAVERDRELIGLGKELVAASGKAALESASWLQADLARTREFAEHDLVVLSYALGELTDAASAELVSAAWKAASKVLVVIEPGTRRGFAKVLDARQQLISGKARMIAPCPHELACPMAEAGDWCHFAERVERSSLHRRLKGGSLGWEDEKFSYVAFGKTAPRTAETRIVRHPLIHSGYIQLALCTDHGLDRRTVTKSEKAQFRRARKSAWGEEWSEAQLE